MNKPSIAVVILNYNGRTYLEKFLGNVITCSPEADIIVADNYSSDDSIVFLKENYPNVHLIQNKENGGFARGYNCALKELDYTYYMLLNSDIEVTPNWLQPLQHAMNSNATLAGVQPKIRSFQNKYSFEHAGAAGGYLDRNYFPFCRGRIIDQIEEDFGQYDGETDIFWASGAALFIRSTCFHQEEGFDEDFFAHMEEIDLCWRIQRKGYMFRVIPSSIVYHVGGGTLPYSSPRKTFLNFRNSLYMLIKNHQGWLAPKLVYRLTLDGIAGVRFLCVGEFSQLGAVLAAHYHMYCNLSKFLGKRKQLKKTSTHTPIFYTGSILWARYMKRITTFSSLNQRLFRSK